jgi:DNA-binding LacI/PurR family transcriptional regulator
LNEAIRLKTIAEKLGVSISTVSRVLNDKPGISQVTREMVLQELHRYRAQLAPAIRPEVNAHRFIGIVGRRRSEKMDSIYFHHSINGFESVFRGFGFASLQVSIHSDEISHTSSLDSLMPDQCAGYILRGQSLSVPFVLKVLSLGKPVVLLENKLMEHQVNSVICNDYEGALSTTSYLIRRGHKNIVHITGPGEWYNNRERARGYRDSMTSHGMKPVLIHHEDTTLHFGEASFNEIRSQAPETTAVFAVNDTMAIGLMDAARRAGVSIPKELAVVGFDDIPWSSLSHPSLTTSHIPIEKMGEMAAHRILQLIADADAPPAEIKVPVTFIERDSV